MSGPAPERAERLQIPSVRGDRRADDKAQRRDQISHLVRIHCDQHTERRIELGGGGDLPGAGQAALTGREPGGGGPVVACGPADLACFTQDVGEPDVEA